MLDGRFVGPVLQQEGDVHAQLESFAFYLSGYDCRLVMRPAADLGKQCPSDW